MWKLIILLQGYDFGGPVILDEYPDLAGCQVVAQSVVGETSKPAQSWGNADASVGSAFCINSKTGESVGFE